MAILELQDLHVSFGTRDGIVHAVDGVSLSVDRGRTLGIVGESGSGKSVTALTVMGLTRLPNATIEGRVLFDGVDLLKVPTDELRRIRGKRIAMIFQDPLSSLHPLYKVGWQIVEAIRAHEDVSEAVARRRAVDALKEVGIPSATERMDSYPHELSGGMRQRVMIAMALVLDPEILIADEPTTALDVTVQSQILDLIRRLQDEHDTGVVLITHDLGVVAETADEVAVMYAGRIAERGPLATVLDAPEHPYTWGLLQSMPRLDTARTERLHAIGGQPPSLIRVPSGCPFHPRCPYAFSVCPQAVPPVVESQPGHAVACHLRSEDRRRIGRQVRAEGVAA
jgi:peptide/nickel transport system ATP-binding protein